MTPDDRARMAFAVPAPVRIPIAAPRTLSSIEQRLAQALARIAELEARLAAYESQGASHASPLPATLTHNGRPVLTADQAAAQVGRSLATVSRYCDSGFWQAAQVGGRWLIYADQSLSTKHS